MTQTFKLDEPVEFGSRTVTELTLRKATAKDIRSVRQNMCSGDLLDIAISLCGEPKTLIDSLSAADGMRLIELVGNALVGGGSS